MPHRNIFLGKTRLISLGLILTFYEIEALIKGKIATLTGYCPILKRLICSSLFYKLEVLENGAYLHYFLGEIHQAHFGMDLEGEQCISRARDPFRSEVTIVVEALERVRGNITLVAGPGIADLDLLLTAAGAAATRSVRAEMTKDRGKSVELPGFESTVEVVIPKVPRLFPDGTPMRVSAVIHDLSKTEAILRSVRVIDAKGRESVDPALPAKIAMTRNIDGPQTSHRAVLMEAWEQTLRLKMDVIALRKWADASIGEFALVKVLPLRRRRPAANHQAEDGPGGAVGPQHE